MAKALSQNKQYGPPLKGLNSRYAVPTISEQEAAVLQNFQVNSSGLLETYPGYTLDGSPFPANPDSWIRTLFNFKGGTSINWLLAAAQDDGNTNSTFKVDIKYTTGDGTYNYITHNIGTAAFTTGNTTVTGTNTYWETELKSGDKIKLDSDPDTDYTEIASVNSNTSLTLVSGGYLGSTSAAAAYDARKIWNIAGIPAMCNFNGNVIITNGYDQPQHYNGVSLNNIVNTYIGTVQTSSGSTFPFAKYVWSYKTRCFFANDSTDGSGMWWTHDDDETTLDPASFVDVGGEDGGVIVSGTSFANSIIALKSNGRIYQIVGNFDDSIAGQPASINRVDYSEFIGTIAPQSNVVHGMYLYFMAQNGLYKIDKYWLQVQKASWNVDPEIQNFNFQLTPSISKSFPFADKAEWDSGSEVGFYSPLPGTLNTFFDDYRITNAQQGANLCSIAIGLDNVMHVAYVPITDSTKITYVRYQPNGIPSEAGPAIEIEDTGLSTLDVIAVSIAVSAADNTVGICYATSGGGPASFRIVERTPDSGPTLGTWETTVDIGGPSYDPQGISNLSFLYSPGGVPQLAWIAPFTTDNATLLGYSQRNSGSWVNVNIGSLPIAAAHDLQVSLVLDPSSNPFISFAVSSTYLYAYKSVTGGATWVNIDGQAPGTINVQGNIQGYLDHAGTYYTIYTDTSGHIIKRNHTGTATTTLDGTANSLLRGHGHIYQNYQGVAPTNPLSPNQDVEYWLNVHGTSPTQVEEYHFEHTASVDNTLTNPTVNVITLATYDRPGSNPMVNNGQVFANVGYGTNTNEIVVRRITFYGNWTSPQETDSSLTAWGQYVVTNSNANGGTLSYQLALAASGSADSFVNIVPPTLISSNPSLNIVAARIFFTIGSWAGASIGSLILNYTGGGVGPTQIVGTEFFNEAYWAASQVGQLANNIILECDISNAFLEPFYPTSALANFNTVFYGGSSLQGDVYKLKQGYLFNGATYNCDYQSKEDFLSAPILYKDLNRIFVMYETQATGSFTFSYRLDNYATAGGSAWVPVVIDQTQNGFFEVNVMQSNVRSIQFRVQSTANGFATKIIGFVLVYGMDNLH